MYMILYLLWPRHLLVARVGEGETERQIRSVSRAFITIMKNIACLQDFVTLGS